MLFRKMSVLKHSHDTAVKPYKDLREDFLAATKILNKIIKNDIDWFKSSENDSNEAQNSAKDVSKLPTHAYTLGIYQTVEIELRGGFSSWMLSIDNADFYGTEVFLSRDYEGKDVIFSTNSVQELGESPPSYYMVKI